MTIFRHVVSGPGPAGDYWSATAHSAGEVTTAGAQTQWLNVLDAFIGDVLEAMWSTEQQATEATTTALSSTTGKNVEQVSTPLTYKGTGTGLTLPQRTAVVIGMRTSLPTRSGRGRAYYPAPDSSHFTSDGVLNAADQAALAQAYADGISAAAPSVSFGVFHRSTLTITPIIQITVAQLTGTQRRRTNKVQPSYASANV